MYSPYQRLWLATLNDNIPYYLEDCPTPKANGESIRTNEKFSALFEKEVPKELEGHVLEPHDKSKMEEVWPAGEDAAREVSSIQLCSCRRTGPNSPFVDFGPVPNDESTHFAAWGGESSI